MSVELESLTYTSLASPELDTAELERILQSARINNAMDGLTGFLIYNGHAFLQVLEGTEIAINDVMERIRADDRHRNVVVANRRQLRARAFPDWTMGYWRLEGVADPRVIDRALERDTAEPTRSMLLAMAESLSTRA